jgi:hypothetical protein
MERCGARTKIDGGYQSRKSMVPAKTGINGGYENKDRFHQPSETGLDFGCSCFLLLERVQRWLRNRRCILCGLGFTATAPHDRLADETDVAACGWPLVT